MVINVCYFYVHSILLVPLKPFISYFNLWLTIYSTTNNLELIDCDWQEGEFFGIVKKNIPMRIDFSLIKGTLECEFFCSLRELFAFILSDSLNSSFQSSSWVVLTLFKLKNFILMLIIIDICLCYTKLI